jgi:hypothetical protein
MTTKDSAEPNPPPSCWSWILILGGIGYAVGTFAPMAVYPGDRYATFGGLIFGPGAALLGLLLYGVCVLFGVCGPAGTSSANQWVLLWTCGAIVGVGTLLRIFPGPELRGYVFEIQVHGCTAPSQSADKAVEFWQHYIPSQPDWQADVRHRLQEANAVVLDATVIHENGIYVNRKPWNKGRISVSGWHPPTGHEQKRYYDDGGHCSDYPIGSKSVRFVSDDYIIGITASNKVQLPSELSEFLLLPTVRHVPDEYQRLVGNP